MRKMSLTTRRLHCVAPVSNWTFNLLKVKARGRYERRDLNDDDAGQLCP